MLTSLGLHLVADAGALEIHMDESEIVPAHANSAQIVENTFN